MKSSDAIGELCGALDTEMGRDAAFDIALGELIGKRRREHDKHMREAEASKLLPLGPEVAAERLGVCRRSVYYMSERARKRVQAVA